MKNITATTCSNYTSSTSTDFPSKAEGIAWCSAIATEAVLIVVGNFLTIVLFAVNKKLRKKSLLLIVNMAFADMLGGVFLPLDIYLFVGDVYQLWTPTWSASLFIFNNIIFYGFLQALLISAALISCERFYAICWPLKHRTLSMRTYHIVVFTGWTLAVLVSTVFTVVFMFISDKIAFNTLMSCFLTLLVIVCGCNIGIWRTVKRRRISAQQQRRASQNQRLTRTLLFVSVVALLSWLPIITVTFLMSVYEIYINASIS